MYNLLKYSANYRKTTGSLWDYYRDEPTNPLSSNSEWFKCKTSITGNTYDIGVGEADYDEKEAEGDNPEIVAPNELEFQITDTKLYVPVVTLSKENDIKLSEQLKTGFKRTIK